MARLVPVARSVVASRNEAVAAPSGESAPVTRLSTRRRRRNATTPSEAVIEGFFVARMAGRLEAERQSMTDVGASPSAYSQGMSAPTFRRIVLLPRDPQTLFVFFDAKTAGIELRAGERAVVRIFDDGQIIRQLEAEQTAHGVYVEGLQSLRTYYAEAWALNGGGERFLGPSSNAVTLPGVGAPAERVRFLRVPWSLPLPRLRDFTRSGQARVSEREGEVRVAMRSTWWYQEGIEGWDPTISGMGRWVKQTTGDEELVAEEREVDAEIRVGDSGPRDQLPTSSGIGRPSSFTLVRPGRK